ncbi:hypothetical protein MMC07_008255 [Pseudocyphellaria aurata]|nr:hypothetical protein [Pseudocyphellaria aurata]
MTTIYLPALQNVRSNHPAALHLIKNLKSLSTPTMNQQNGYGHVSILDIRQDQSSVSPLNDIHEMLRPEEGGQKRLPTSILYDAQGLKLFEEITFLEEYYLTNAEIEVLEKYASDIASLIPAGSRIVELGSGNLRKVAVLLQALEKIGQDVDYYALDLSESELRRTLSIVAQEGYRHVKCQGLHGTYEDGLIWLKRPEILEKPSCVLFLGSTIGNFAPAEAAGFLKGFSDVLGPKGRMIVGLDACQERDKVCHAYNDKEGKTREFYLNGLAHANTLLGRKTFEVDKWDIVGTYDEVAGRHRAFYVPATDAAVDGVWVKAGEKILFEESYKYSRPQSTELWQTSGFVARAVFGNSIDDYHLHVLDVPTFSFSLEPEKYAARPLPSLQEFQQLWAAWDTITRRMIPGKDLLSKPIKLRNCCLFYMGHIPTFLDIHVTRAIQGSPTHPAYFYDIFERGIDPDVDDPEKCHTHSEIPDTWPPLHEVLAFQDRVRRRLTSLFENGSAETNRRLARSLWLCFEHEAMHLETLLYMLVQSDKTLPPPGVAPDFSFLSKQARLEQVPNDWFHIPARKLTLGLEDPEKGSSPNHYFGWDNEKPQRVVAVQPFEAMARPISNEDYALYLEQTQQPNLPAMWAVSDGKCGDIPLKPQDDASIQTSRAYMNGHSEPLSEAFLNGKSVKTVYGPVPLKHALDWPMIASYNELLGCANWMGGRIPTFEEAESIYTHVRLSKTKEVELVQSRTISAVNGHLSNNGVDESPPSQRPSTSNAEQSPNPHQLFTDLEGCNVGFQHYHPTPVTQNGNKLSGRGDMGGVWEWTSTVLHQHEGFKPMELYPGYTADFFDDKHNIVLGGSWATHPRIAGRKTFVNWYQRNYPFAWAGARVVRDITTA